jgi:hypothetical protein
MDLTAATWHESKNLSNGGAGRVEAAVVWRKSTYSTNGGADCVETAMLGPVVAVRDSKDPDGPKLAFTGAEWGAFLARVKDHELGMS